MEIRSVVWQGAIELVKRHPLFGTGVETFGYSYFWTRPVHHNILSEWDFLYNKAHNEYLNFATTTGLFGIFTYILLIISILKLFAKTSIVTKPTDKITVRTLVKTNNNSDQKINLSHPLFLGFLSILITNFFGFSVVNIALFFFLFPAIIITSDTKPDKFLILSLKIIPYYPTLLLLTLLTLYSLNSIRLLYISDLNYNQGKNHLLTSSLKPALDSLTLAHNQNPKEPVFTATLAETEAQAAASLAQELKTLSASDSSKYKETFSSSIKQYLNNYENHISLTLSQNPYHTNFYKSKAKSEIYLSTIDSKYLSQAADTMLHLTTLTPTDAKTYYSLGIIYLNLKRSDLAITNLKKAIDLKPDYDQAKELLKNLN
jgi:tetratricopeptide (TPR) repeat protein